MSQLSSVALDRVEIVVVKVAKLGHVLGRRLPLVKQNLDFGLQESLLTELADSTSRCGVLLAVEASAIAAKRRDGERDNRLDLEHVAEGLDNVHIAALAFRPLTGVEARGEGALVAPETEEQDVNGRPLHEGLA